MESGGSRPEMAGGSTGAAEARAPSMVAGACVVAGVTLSTIDLLPVGAVGTPCVGEDAASAALSMVAKLASCDAVSAATVREGAAGTGAAVGGVVEEVLMASAVVTSNS